MIRQLQQRLTTPSAHAIAVLIIVLIGLGLRIYRLDAQSFWYDEGNSARIAERSLQLIVEGAAGDIHPPLYYLALHFWRAAFGDTETALRLLSVACGVALIVFTYLLGAALFRPRTGLIAAALVAFSPFAVYYSQEARMYILLALLAAASTWALAEMGRRYAGEEGKRSRGAEEKGRRQVLIAGVYVAATAAGLYTQYAYPFVMAAQGACVVLWLLANKQNRRRNLLAYAGINVAAIALFLPWLPIAIRQITVWGVTPQTYDLGPAMLDAYRWLVVGRTLPLDQSAVPLAVIAVLVLPGLALNMHGLGSGPRFRLAPLLVFMMAALPFALLFVFKLYREAYLKFLLVCVAPLLILTAHGIASVLDASGRLSRSPTSRTGVGTVAGVLLVIGFVMLPSLNNLYNNPAYARDDYRGIARMIETGARPDDAILFSAPNQWEVFTYYHRTGAPSIPLAYRPPDDHTVDAQLSPIAAQYARLFVLYYGERESDPAGRFERWLAEHAYKADEEWVGNIRLATYATRMPVPANTRTLTATFGDALSLVSASYDARDAAVGDLVTVQLHWRANVKPAGRYKVFVHIGAADAPPVAQNDAEPLAGFHATDTWTAGESITDRRAVAIKAGATAGSYGVYVGVYDGATGQRLPVTAPDGRVAGDRLWLGDISITAAK